MFLSSELYFQKQGPFSAKCGKCALNNLMGGKQFSTQMLDDICTKLEKQIKQDYRHALGGDYDVNVLIDALLIFDMECQWLSSAKSIHQQEDNKKKAKTIGFLINRNLKPNVFKAIVGLSDRHWIAVRLYQQHYYLFDSKSDAGIPEHIMNIAKFIQSELQRGSIIIKVVQKQVQKNNNKKSEE